MLDEDKFVVGGEGEGVDPVGGFDGIEGAFFAGGVLAVAFIEVEDPAGGNEFFGEGLPGLGCVVGVVFHFCIDLVLN